MTVTDDTYVHALADLNAMSMLTRRQLASHDIAGEYESAIINVAIIFDKSLDTVFYDLQAYRAGRRSQETVA